MHTERNRGAVMMRAASLLLILTLLSSAVVAGRYARYTTSSSANDAARVAGFVLSLKNGANSKILDLSGIQKPGDSKTYTFTVTNNSGGFVSEVAESYTLTMAVNGSMPLTLKLNNVDLTRTVQDTANAADAATVTYAASVQSSVTYTLTATWPNNETDPKYANGSAVGEVVLTLTGGQID